MSTMRDVARKAGVSPMTVSRVLSAPNLVHPATRERVLTAMDEMHYVPKQGTKVSSSEVRSIALVVADFTNPFFTQIARGVEWVARRHGYGMTLHNTGEDPEREWESLIAVRETRASGVIWVPCGDTSSMSARILLDADVPTVLVDRLIPGVPSFDAVISDNRIGAKAIVSTLLANHRQPIVAVMGQTVTSVVRDRLLGLQDALADHHQTFDPNNVVYCDPIHPKDVLWSEIRPRVPSGGAVFAWNQIAASAVFRAAKQANVHPPEDVMIATFDNPDPYGITPGFFVVAQQDPYKMGTESANLLFRRLNQPNDPLKSTLILPVSVHVGSQSESPRSIVLQPS